MHEYAAQRERPRFVADGRLVARRALRQGDRVYQIDEDVPRGDLTPRQIAVLWDQGWIDTLPQANSQVPSTSGESNELAAPPPSTQSPPVGPSSAAEPAQPSHPAPVPQPPAPPPSSSKPTRPQQPNPLLAKR